MADVLTAEIAAMRTALHEFCETIEATGGVYPDGVGYSPVQTRNDDDHEGGWYDLGHAYMTACNALCRMPMIVELETDDDND